MSENDAVPMEGASAGTLLRQAREAAGLHVSSLAASLKVPVRKLEALEEDRYEELPDAVFVRALASSVCRTLKSIPPRCCSGCRRRRSRAWRTAVNPSMLRSARPATGAARLLSQVSRPVVLTVLALLLAALVLIFLPMAQRGYDAVVQANRPQADVPAQPAAAPGAVTETITVPSVPASMPVPAAPPPAVAPAAEPPAAGASAAAVSLRAGTATATRHRRRCSRQRAGGGRVRPRRGQWPGGLPHPGALVGAGEGCPRHHRPAAPHAAGRDRHGRRRVAAVGHGGQRPGHRGAGARPAVRPGAAGARQRRPFRSEVMNPDCLPIEPAAPRARRSAQARVAWGARVVTVGGDAPVRVQSMTNTDTQDAIATAIQVKELAVAGSELVRITVNTPEAAQQVPYIREQLDRMGIDVPLVGDFHYNGHRLLTDFPACAEALSKYRINPGNVGKGDKKDRQFAQMIEAALKWDRPVRIGVNWGSLDQELLAQLMDENAGRATPWDARQVMYEALITSAIQSARLAEELGMRHEQVLLSCKVSGVQDLVSVYRELARRCDYPLHLGLTEAGMGTKGTVASSVALGILLQEGIGDTIRVSLTPQPGESRTQEVVIAAEIL